tara:strand:- start:69 stop:1361 length:1293 start_codon:yes stop_codon:yes gene_type:complete
MNLDWLNWDKEHCWHPYTQHGIDTNPLAVVSAQDATLHLADGRKLIDGISSWWSVLHGHAQGELIEALQYQTATLDHVLFAGCTHEPAASLSRQIVKMVNENTEGFEGPNLNRVFFSDNGSTAVEVALKMAYQSAVKKGEAHKNIFIALEDSYHGDTFGAMSLSDPDPFFQTFKPFLFEVVRIPPTEEALQAALEQHGPNTAAVILEPILQGAAGMNFHSADFVRATRRLCDEHNTFFIADEVATAFGRLGSLLACDFAQVRPDFLCLSKGLSGGILPLALTLTHEGIFDLFKSPSRADAFFHGHTFTANPIACNAANASLRLFKKNNVPERFTEIGKLILDNLSPELKSHPQVELRHQGAIVALALKEEDAGYLSGIGEKLRAACLAHNEVLLRPLGSVLYTFPLACVTDEEAVKIAKALSEIALSALD